MTSDPAGIGSSQEQPRFQFYDALLGRSPGLPEDDLPFVMSAWLEFSQADWCCLWLKNPLRESREESTSPFKGVWELIGIQSRTGDHPALTGLTLPDDCFSEYAVTSGKSIASRRPFDQKLEHNGKAFNPIADQRVKDFLDRNGCQSLCVVPILSPDSSDARTAIEAAELKVVGSIGLYYTDPDTPVPQTQSGKLRRMGQLTAQVMINALQHQQLRVQAALNDMAAKHLAPRIGRAQDHRKAYLDDLIAMIQREVHGVAISVFFRQHFEHKIACIATTGLCKPDPDPAKPPVLLTPADWGTVTYGANELNHWTSRVYRTGKIQLLVQEERLDGHAPKTRDMKGPVPYFSKPLIMVPLIPGPAGPHEAGPADHEPKAMGVIRVNRHDPTLISSADASATLPASEEPSFTPYELTLLTYIAQQVSPVLQTFEGRILRENILQTVKHELYAPLVMTGNSIDELEESIETNQKPNEYTFGNLRLVQHLMANLIEVLDTDPTVEAPLNKQRTFLEGDVVARVKSMLTVYADVEGEGMSIYFRDFRDREDPSNSIPAVNVDRRAIERVLANLIMNAVKYGQPKSQIVVDPYLVRPGSAMAHDEHDPHEPGVYIAVSNYGPGVDDEDAERVFMPQFRSSKVARIRGLGLGLPISRRLMVQHGGTLELVRPKDPTIFRIFLPWECIAR